MNTILTKTACMCITGMLVFAIGTAQAQTPKPCDTCEDLCRLMDKYQQRNKAIEIWQQYTGHGGKNIPEGVTTGNEIEHIFQMQFNEWLAKRRLDHDASGAGLGSLPCRLKRGDNEYTREMAGSHFNLYVDTKTCKILTSDDQELTGPVKDAFEVSFNCKADSDALLAHEQVHQQQCINAHKMDPSGGEAFLDSPGMTAESELDAYTKQRDELGNAIRDILRKKGCGWESTEGQKQVPESVPSLKQIQDMSERAWKAAAALSDGGVNTSDGGVQ
jgi:hypothetical protein